MGNFGIILYLSGLVMASPPAPHRAKTMLSELGVEFKQHSLTQYFLDRVADVKDAKVSGTWASINTFTKSLSE